VTSPSGHTVLGSPLNALMSERAAQQVGSAWLLDSSTHLLPSNALTRQPRCACGFRKSTECIRSRRAGSEEATDEWDFAGYWRGTCFAEDRGAPSDCCLERFIKLLTYLLKYVVTSTLRRHHQYAAPRTTQSL